MLRLLKCRHTPAPWNFTGSGPCLALKGATGRGLDVNAGGDHALPAWTAPQVFGQGGSLYKEGNLQRSNLRNSIAGEIRLVIALCRWIHYNGSIK